MLLHVRLPVYTEKLRDCAMPLLSGDAFGSHAGRVLGFREDVYALVEEAPLWRSESSVGS